MTYRILLAFHIVSVISWMAGILYLIRLFVYHASESEAVVIERFKLMEYRLYKYITFPAMISSYIFGLGMIISQPVLLSFSWLQLKLFFVVLLTLSTLYSGKLVKNFANDENPHSEKFYRFFNEAPTLLMIAIVFLVILKLSPF